MRWWEVVALNIARRWVRDHCEIARAIDDDDIATCIVAQEILRDNRMPEKQYRWNRHSRWFVDLVRKELRPDLGRLSTKWRLEVY